MKKCVSALLGLSLVVMTGCSGKGDYDTFGKMHQNHDLMETARITNQSNSIMTIATHDIDGTEDKTVKALMKVIAMDKIAELTPKPLEVEAPTTGMDVLGKLVDHTPFIMMGAATSYLGYLMSENAGNKFFMDDNASINESFKSDYSWMNERDDITTTTTSN